MLIIRYNRIFAWSKLQFDTVTNLEDTDYVEHIYYLLHLLFDQEDSCNLENMPVDILH